MAEARMVDPHNVVMTGENSFIRLSNDGSKTIADRTSHWRVLWSPAGQGHVLFIVGGLLWVGTTMGWTSFQQSEGTGTPWNPPIWPVKLAIPLAALLLLLQGLSNLLRDSGVAKKESQAK